MLLPNATDQVRLVGILSNDTFGESHLEMRTPAKTVLTLGGRLMRSVSALTLILGIQFVVGCGSPTSSVKQLDESTAMRMVGQNLSTMKPDLGILVGPLLPLLDARHTSEDYTTGRAGIYGPLLARLIQQGLITQRATRISCPEVSGTFVNAYDKGYGKTETDTWILEPVPGTNELQGKCIWSTNPDPAYCCTWSGTAAGTIEPDGKATISCSLTQAVNKAQSAEYTEQGATANLRVTDIETTRARNFAGPATGRKVATTWYDYAATPAFRSLINSGPEGPYVDVGNFEVGKVTELQLDTDTQASANFAYTVSLNSTGRLLYPSAGLSGSGHVVFGKKPDQSWAINSITNVPRFRPMSGS
jgi:hypothetical protein